jgi:hypothetical protein
MIGWLRRLVGPGKKKSAPRPAPKRKPVRSAPSARALTPERFQAARRRVVLYFARARMPIRQATTVRQLWIADLGQVYEAIRTSPTEMILERAGDVGMRHEEGFRQALLLTQALQPPPECEEVHQALVNWLTYLHSACLALMDARRLKDRSMLGMFRERLGLARRHAQTLALLRNQLVTVYKLRIDPTIQKNRATDRAAGPEQGEGRSGTNPAALEQRRRGATG